MNPDSDQHVPESGAANAAAAPVTDERGHVQTPLTCRSCGYALRGLPVTGSCPECGLAVRASLRRDMLEHSDPAWLRKLVLGCRIFNVAFASTLAVVSIGILAGIALATYVTVSSGGRPGPLMSFQADLQLAITLVTALAALIELAGVWLLTEPDPGRAEDERTLSFRRIARIGMLFGVLASPFGTFINQLMRGGPATMTSLIVPSVIGLLVSIVAVVAWFAFFSYESQLMSRVPARRLARHTRLLAWCYAAALGLMTLSGLAALMITLLMGSQTSQQPRPGALMALTFIGIGSCATMAIYLSTHLWALIVQFLVRRKLTSVVGRAAAAGS